MSREKIGLEEIAGMIGELRETIAKQENENDKRREILSIVNSARRQKAIAENMHLFGDMYIGGRKLGEKEK